MIQTQPLLPGVRFQVVRPPEDVDTLRTDIAGFAGPTERGPVGQLTRVNGWRDYVHRFGAEVEEHHTPFCLRGYFENGGQVAWLVRVLESPVTAGLDWDLDDTAQWAPSTAAAAGFSSTRFRIEASSPGAWANGMRVHLDYTRRGRLGKSELSIRVVPPTGAIEHLDGLDPALLQEEVEERSALIRVSPVPGHVPAPTVESGPSHLSWGPLRLQNGSEQPAGLETYREAAEQLLEEPEVALIAFPDLYQLETDQAHTLLAETVAHADTTLDRQVLAAPPVDLLGVEPASSWVNQRRKQMAARSARTVAVYFPWLEVRSPLGGVIEPLRRIPPVGHVAGLISRLDRERGAHHTPANAELYDVVDASNRYEPVELATLTERGLNPLRCRPGRGLQVWGGRTLADAERELEGLFLAHRRLIHRLVRAIYRVAKPLVFDVNGPQLRLAIVRGITTVLLQAYRAGALKGEIPEQAFRVTCDDTNNPPEVQELGQVLCEVKLAPAAPMEFITLRIALSEEGRLEVISP